MDSLAAAPVGVDEGHDALAENQPLRVKIEGLILETHVPDPKRAFIENVWPALRSEYEAMLKVLQEHCENLLKQRAIACQISGRTKALDSIRKSLDRREKHRQEHNQKGFGSVADIFREMHDLVGLRIVLEFPDEMGKVIGLVEEMFHQEKEPAIFSPDREVGQSWKAWFGAYQTRNHRVSLKPEKVSPEDEALSRYIGVMVEVQITTVAESLYNKLAHPLLYKGSSGPLTRRDEMVADMSHGISLCYALCLMYMKDKVGNTDDSESTAAPDGIADIERSGTRFFEGLKRSANLDAAAAAIPPEIQGRPTPPSGCDTIDELKGWLSSKLDDIVAEMRSRPPQALGDGDGEAKSSPMPFVVPYDSNPDFVGRSAILDELKQELGHGQPPTTWQPRAALYGLGGIGKTQIALNYTYWLRETHSEVSVFWVHASNAERFRQAYASIAEECRIPGHDDPKQDVLTLVKTWLAKKDCCRWLMVLDNADDMELFLGQKVNLAQYLPECSRGSLLVTSKDKQVASRLIKGKCPIEVVKMDEGETVQLLSTRLRGVETNPAELEALSSRLEHLPLALMQAAAFIQENSITIGEYLGLMDKGDQHLIDLLSEEFETVGRDSETPRALAKSWILSYEQIQRQNPSAGDLLSLMSLFDRHAIPLEFLSSWGSRKETTGKQLPKKGLRQVFKAFSGRLAAPSRSLLRPSTPPEQDATEEVNGELQLTRALGILKAFSFVTGSEAHGFDMHRLVQLVTRKWLAKTGNLHRFADEAISTVQGAYPLCGHDTRTKCTAYLPHAYAVLGHHGTGSKDETIARAALLSRTSRFFDYHGKLREAEQLGSDSVTLLRDVLGDEHHSTLASMSAMAITYQRHGRLKKAEQLQSRVLETKKRLLGKNHHLTLDSMYSLSWTYRNQGRLKEAEELQLQAVGAQKKLLGEEHPKTLASIDQLATTYLEQGRNGESAQLFREVLEIRKRVLGEEHLDTGKSMFNLAGACLKQGQSEEAAVLQLRALETYKKTLGDEDPTTLVGMSALATTYMHQRRLEEAEEIASKVFRIKERILGEEHFDTLFSAIALAYIWRGMGRTREAVALLQPRVALLEQATASDRPQMTSATALRRLAEWQDEIASYDGEAEY